MKSDWFGSVFIFSFSPALCFFFRFFCDSKLEKVRRSEIHRWLNGIFSLECKSQSNISEGTTHQSVTDIHYMFRYQVEHKFPRNSFSSKYHRSFFSLFILPFPLFSQTFQSFLGSGFHSETLPLSSLVSKKAQCSLDFCDTFTFLFCFLRMYAFGHEMLIRWPMMKK